MKNLIKCYCGHTTTCDCIDMLELGRIPKEPKQETLEEAAERYGWRIKTNSFSDRVKANELAESAKQDFINGAKWQQERSYSEEDLKEAFYNGWLLSGSGASFSNAIKKWFEQFKKK